jgi:hypothetical protein
VNVVLYCCMNTGKADGNVYRLVDTLNEFCQELNHCCRLQFLGQVALSVRACISFTVTA